MSQLTDVDGELRGALPESVPAEGSRVAEEDVGEPIGLEEVDTEVLDLREAEELDDAEGEGVGGVELRPAGEFDASPLADGVDTTTDAGSMFTQGGSDPLITMKAWLTSSALPLAP